jgi:hypothetical protein
MSIFQNLADDVVRGLISALSDTIYPLMFFGFFITLALKLLVVYTIKRQQWFAKEFEKRLLKHLDGRDTTPKDSFYVSCKKLLEKTYYEVFEVRGIMQRRNLDYISSPLDRLFAIQHGCARFVKDTLKEIRFLKHNGENPRFLEISKTVMGNNPAFSRLFGWLPLGPVNDLLNLIPGLFIIGGIFGTFLGIMQGLPELSGLDIKNPEVSKDVMDTFLIKIAFSIGTSVIGILFSVLLSVVYSIAQIEKVYVKVVDTYDRCLTRLWESSASNDVPNNLAAFDEHKDPVEALAQMAVDKEATSGKWAKRLGDSGNSGDEGGITKKAS